MAGKEGWREGKWKGMRKNEKGREGERGRKGGRGGRVGGRVRY